MFRCDICGKTADKHHIVYRSHGGIDFPMNIMYLCNEHHRGKEGPHKNRNIDLQYKLQLKKKLEYTLNKSYFRSQELVDKLKINQGMIKRILKELKLYKEGYKTSDIVFRLMGNEDYQENTNEEFYEFIANF